MSWTRTEWPAVYGSLASTATARLLHRLGEHVADLDDLLVGARVVASGSANKRTAHGPTVTYTTAISHARGEYASMLRPITPSSLHRLREWTGCSGLLPRRWTTVR